MLVLALSTGLVTAMVGTPGKTFLVTGSTDGIGYATVEQRTRQPSCTNRAGLITHADDL